MMQITDVRIFVQPKSDTKLKAYATITFDQCFVVRNVKVIEGSKGLFVAMPSERTKEACPKCNHRNAVRSRFCNQCGAVLPAPGPTPVPVAGPGHGEEKSDEHPTEHRDIAHPITMECREYIQKKVLEAYETARRQAA